MGVAFWRFSLVFYSRPGVAEALLRLQDRDGCDVNLILLALWCGAVLRRRLDAADLASAEAAAAPLRDVVVGPVRELRRSLKPSSESDAHGLRRRVAALELAAERRVQIRLAAAIGAARGDADPITVPAANLALYLGPERAALPEGAALLSSLRKLVDRY